MLSVYVCAILTISGLFGTTSVQGSSCTNDEITKCFGSVVSYLKDKKVATFSDETQLNHVCDEMKGAVTCVKKSCSESDPASATWVGMRDYLAYSCGDGRKAFLASMRCMESKPYTNLTNVCSHTLEVDLNKAAASKNEQKQCKAITDFIHCVESGTITQCNKEAGNYVRISQSKALAPLMKVMHCSACSIKASVIVLVMAFLYAALF